MAKAEGALEAEEATGSPFYAIIATLNSAGVRDNEGNPISTFNILQGIQKLTEVYAENQLLKAMLAEVRRQSYAGINDFDNFTSYRLQCIHAVAEGKKMPHGPVFTVVDR